MGRQLVRYGDGRFGQSTVKAMNWRASAPNKGITCGSYGGAE